MNGLVARSQGWWAFLFGSVRANPQDNSDFLSSTTSSARTLSADRASFLGQPPSSPPTAGRLSAIRRLPSSNSVPGSRATDSADRPETVLAGENAYASANICLTIGLPWLVILGTSLVNCDSIDAMQKRLEKASRQENAPLPENRETGPAPAPVVAPAPVPEEIEVEPPGSQNGQGRGATSAPRVAPAGGVATEPVGLPRELRLAPEPAAAPDDLTDRVVRSARGDSANNDRAVALTPSPLDIATLEDATPFELAADSQLWQTDAAERVLEVGLHAFRFEPTATAVFEVTLSGFPTIGRGEPLMVVDQDFHQLMSIGSRPTHDDDASAQWLLTANRQYYVVVRIADPDFFELSVEQLAIPDPRERAEDIELDDAHQLDVERGFDETHPEHVFRIEPTFTGQLNVRVVAGNSELDPFVSVFDEDFNTLNMNDDADADSLDAATSCRVLQGKTYFIQASPYSATWGNFRLNLQGIPGTDPFANARPLHWNNSRIEAFSMIARSSESEYFSFEATKDGPMTAVMYAARENGLDPIAFVFDEEGRLLGMNDDAFTENHDAAVTFLAKKGQRYYLHTSSYATEVGDYRLVICAGGIPSPFDQAKDLVLRKSMSCTARGSLDPGRPSTVFRFVVPQYANVSVELARGMASDLLPQVALYDSQHEMLVESEITINEEDSFALTRLGFRANAGEEFFFVVDSLDETWGEFILSVNLHSRPHPLEQPLIVELDERLESKVTGSIDHCFGEEAVQFIAHHSGPFTVECNGARNSRLQPQVAVFEASGKLVLRSRSRSIQGITSPHEVGATWQTEAGKAYCILISGQYGSRGAYQLSMRPGVLISPFDRAPQLDFNEKASAEWKGKADGSGNMSLLAFQVPEAGRYSVWVEPTKKQSLDTLATLLNDKQSVLAESDDGLPHSNDAAFSWDAEANTTYYLHVGAYEGDPGDYRVKVFPGKLPSPLDDALETVLTPERTWRCTADIQKFGEFDYYKVVSPIDGKMTVTQRAGAGTTFDAYLMIVDESFEELASNDDAFLDSFDSQVSVHVTAGEPFFIAASSANQELGLYELDLSIDRIVDPFDEPETLELQNGKVEVEGLLTLSHEARVYRLSSENATKLKIRLESVGARAIDTVLSIFNSDRQNLASNDDANDDEMNSELTFDVVAGQTILIHATDYEQQVGEFRLTVQELADRLTDSHQDSASEEVSAK